jgi:hypothetical protein
LGRSYISSPPSRLHGGGGIACYSLQSETDCRVNVFILPIAVGSMRIVYKIAAYIILLMSQGSSGSIVSDYGLDDRAIEVRSLAGAKNFSSSVCVQTGSGAHPASCTMVTGGPFPGGKARPDRDADQSPPPSAEVVND